MNLAALLSTTTMAVNEAETVIPAVAFFVNEAETASKATGATGEQKLASVKAALQSFLNTNFPKLAQSFDAIWTSMTGVIAGLVTLYNTLGVFVHASQPG